MAPKNRGMRIVAAIVLIVALVLAVVSCAPKPKEEAATHSGTEKVVVTTWQYDDDGSPFTWPKAVGWVGLIGVIIAIAITYRGEISGEFKRVPRKSFGHMVAGAFLILFILSTCIQVIPVTYAAVVRVAFPSPSSYAIGPGTHFVLPFVSSVNLYTTRVRPMKIFDIDADTSSVGRPAIYPDIVAWFRLPVSTEKELTGELPIDPNILRALDLRYGPDYEKTFLKELTIAVVKETSGSHVYDYFGSDREKAQDTIQEELNSRLGGLVEIEDFTISYFNYDQAFEDKLAVASQKQLDLESATKDIEIAEQRRLEAMKTAETAKIRGEGERDNRIELAKGDSEALRLIAEQLAQNPRLLEYEWIKKWTGVPPATLIQGQGESSFLLQIPTTTNP